MNKQRRKAITEIVSKLEEIMADLNTLQEEEQEAFDNLPEGLQDSEKGEAMETAAGLLEEAVNSVGDAIDGLGGIE